MKCKKFTSTEFLKEETTKNGRTMLKGNCSICNTKKNKFISGGGGGVKTGGSILNRMINTLPIEMHLPGHNFTGPGTKLNKRLNPDLTPKPWSKPVDRVDKAAYNHDVCYLKHTDTKTRNDVCDKDMLTELSGIHNPSIRERMERGLVSSLIGTEKYFGMGTEMAKPEEPRKRGRPKKNLIVKQSKTPLADEIHKPTRGHFPTKKVRVSEINDTWTADILYLPASHKEANSYLVVLDVFSKYAWVKPIKNKISDTVAKTYLNIFSESGRKPKKLWTDRGGEFLGLIDQTPEKKPGKFDCPHCGKENTNQSGLTQHLNRHCPVLFPEKAKENTTKLRNIILYHTEGKDKAAVAERFVKTIKGKMWKYMTENKTKRIIDVLPDLVKEYNNTVHSTIKMTPVEASKKENEEKVYKTAYEPNENETKKDIEKEILKTGIQEGDRVRISRKKKEGAKGYEPNWSDEIFKVREIKKTNPPTYLLSDAKDHHIQGLFYKQEVQKTEYNFDSNDGYHEPRTKENARIGKEAFQKEALRQKEKKQRQAEKKKKEKTQQPSTSKGAGLGLGSTLPDRVLSNFDLEKVAKDLPFWRGIYSRDRLPRYKRMWYSKFRFQRWKGNALGSVAQKQKYKILL